MGYNPLVNLQTSCEGYVPFERTFKRQLRHRKSHFSSFFPWRGSVFSLLSIPEEGCAAGSEGIMFDAFIG